MKDFFKSIFSVLEHSNILFTHESWIIHSETSWSLKFCTLFGGICCSKVSIKGDVCCLKVSFRALGEVLLCFVSIHFFLSNALANT